MKSLFRLAALAGIVIVASGCSALGQFQDRIGSAVARYCEQPQAEREAYRDLINARTEPNRVEVACAADAPADPPAG